MARIALFFAFIALCSDAFAQEGTASWYSKDSCIKEGTSGVYTASGKVFDENELTAASWFHPFGTRLIVKNLSNQKSVCVTITDRGPSKKLVKKGRIIDLSKRAFSRIANLKEGVVKVDVKTL